MAKTRATESAAPDEEPNDVDLALRHVSREFPEELARAMFAEGTRIEVVGWAETQLTARQRRLDRALWVKVDGMLRLLHLEWQLEWRDEVRLRVFEYHAMQALALASEWTARKLTTPVPRIDSRVVLLSGRDEPWTEAVGYLTAPDDAPLCGVQFRVEAVYQTTLAELFARDNVLWWIFAPLTRDATPEGMREAVTRLKKRVRSRQQLAELASAMIVLADADARQRGLRTALTAHLPQELVMNSWLYQDALKHGFERGEQEGLKKGLRKGLKEGEERGELRALRRTLDATLTTRGLKLTAKRREQIERETNADVLMAWIQAAVTAERIADVFAAR